MRRRRLPTLVAAIGLVAACGAGGDVGPPGAGAVPAAVEVADGWGVAVVRDDLDGPTQLVLEADATEAGDEVEASVLVGELAGGEDAGAGRVRRLGPGGAGDAETVADALLTPTGVVVLEGRLLVQEQDALLQYPPVAGSSGEGPRRLTEGAPPNGRSQGTLTPVRTAVGPAVLATVTGRGSGPEVDGSGELRVVRPTSGGVEIGTVAVGFKNAYAHAFGPDGELYVTEIGDGRYDGAPPPDELDVIAPDVVERALGGGAPYDGGWPRCTGDGDPTEELGVTRDECDALPRPLATFPPGATPTSVAVTADGRVLVALWVEGRVVEVDVGTGVVTDVLAGIGNPQHLLALPDGDVLLTVHDRGELWRLSPP